MMSHNLYKLKNRIVNYDMRTKINSKKDYTVTQISPTGDLFFHQNYILSLGHICIPIKHFLFSFSRKFEKWCARTIFTFYKFEPLHVQDKIDRERDTEIW